jgi:hypothetical protein
VGDVGIRRSLRLHKSFPSLSVYRLVISKHYSYPLKDLVHNTETAYANWMQFINSIELVKQEMPDGRKLRDLVDMFKRTETPSGRQEYLDETTSEWIIGDLRFTVKQE